MLELLLPLVSGAVGGAGAGNILGGLMNKAGGRGASSMVGMVAGAIATYFLGPTLGPIVGSMVGGGALESILGGLVSGAGGGGLASVLFGLVKSMMAKQ